ncbi:MAG TPA: AMP-binding protein [Candidatus Omnitrophota bacterium]|nr:AMP-binding protein [Candidatus Omnitrophota bacterium]HPS19521.1 AMP-binding protein [Candidatus Omnitrophota bacterium]
MIGTFYEKLMAPFLRSTRIFYKYFDEEYTYGRAYSLMKIINHTLNRNNKNRKKIVVYGGKSFPVYCAIYSIILSDNVWIPITPGIPPDRLMAMMELLHPDIFLYEEEIPQGVVESAGKIKMEVISLTDVAERKESMDFEMCKYSPNDWAYVMFTSGSTGVPKGVPMTHLNYINFINNAMEILPFQKGEIFSDYHDFAFDISIFYIFCAPLTEGTIAPIRKKEERMFPLNHIQKNKITVWSSVPSVIACIQRLRPAGKLENSIRIMFLCGEPFSLSILKYCYENLDIKEVYDFYGLTETGVENFYHHCSIDDLERFREKGFVPIGRPLKGNDIKVTEEKELLLSGCQVTPGYLGNIEQGRFETIEGDRWYHTGDIVEKFEDVYFCKGRIDSQVKISGHRIELMDIEVHIKQFPGIKEAICFVTEQTMGVKRLACAVETQDQADTVIPGLEGWLRGKLPEYMVPKVIHHIKAMPTNNNGKIDRKAIREMFSQGAR